MKFKGKKLLTIFEIIIIMLFVSIGFMSLFSVISSAISFTNGLRKEIIAINLAREGMEAIYNIRDTNWKRWSGKKDECWLKINPMVDNGGDGCENDEWINAGNNYIITLGSAGNQKYFLLSGMGNLELDLYNKKGYEYFMCNNNDFWYNCPGGNQNPKEGKFYRIIEGKSLIQKTNGNIINCTKGTDSGCGDNTTKEFVFCSRVEYLSNNRDKVEFCGSITNFYKK